MLEEDPYSPAVHLADHPDALAQALKGPLSPGMLRHIFGHLSQAVILADDQRRILYANRAAEQLFGYPEEAMLGEKTALLYADPDDYQAQGFNRYNIHSSKDPDNYRTRYCQANGTHFLGLTTGGPIRSEDGTVWGFIGIIQPAGVQDSSLDTLQRLHTLVVNNSLDPEFCAAQIIDLGREHFGSTVGLQTRVIDELFQVERCVDSTGRIQPGTQFDCKPQPCPI